MTVFDLTRYSLQVSFQSGVLVVVVVVVVFSVLSCRALFLQQSVTSDLTRKWKYFSRQNIPHHPPPCHPTK